jgi:KaiC/GvpD/RAD55 family RecA-like ATPase
MDFSQNEKDYKWFEAAKSYEQILRSISLPDLSAEECWLRIGYCYDLASRQTKDIEGFEDLRQLAVKAYEKAAELFGENPNKENRGKSSLCLSLAEYSHSWLASVFSEKQKALDKCHSLGRAALEVFKNSGNMLEYGNTANILCQCLFERLYIAETGEEVRAISKEGIETAELAITVHSELENRDGLLLAFSLASLQTWYAANISEQEKDATTLSNRCMSYSENALKLSTQIENPYLHAMSLWAGTLSTLFFTENIESSLKYAKEMLEQASIIGDNYFKGIAGYLLAFVSDWMIPGESNPDRKRKRHEEVLGYSEDAIRNLQLVNQDVGIAETYLFYVESYSSIAREFITNTSEKLVFSRKAIDAGEKGLDYALHSGSLDALGSTLHALSKAYHYYSKLEAGKDEKQKHLRNALGFRREYISVVQRGFATNAWILGVGLVYAAQIEADLAMLDKEEGKIALLQDAISDMNDGVSYCRNWIECRAVPSLVAIVAEFEDTFAEMLDYGYELTSEKENLKKANEVYGNAATDFKKVDLPSRVAESYWKIARNLDIFGEYSQAAGNFEKGFAWYKAAAQKISQFSDFYLDYASYMKAWSLIETAKFEHSNEKYLDSMNNYEKASSLLKQSKSWNHLSSNFCAWSLLEQAEDLSRKDNCEQSIVTFEKAIGLLRDSERVLRNELGRIDKIDEQNLVKMLIRASNIRVDYSNGRIAIEEAKILDKQGDHGASSQKYGSASETFRKIVEIDPTQTGKEVKPLIFLCEAWQKMTLAEAKSSPIMYEEAADLFTLANEHSTKESVSLLALGHSSFCKALEAGTEFEITRNTAMYEETSRYMSSAANYYLRAGFESASDYALATQRLFDAYVYMDTAKREKDPVKEANFYLIAEKVLQISSECFTKAGHMEKTNRIQRLLKKVREDRELALSLSEIFHAPTITSSTASFSTIGPNEEKAVGLERFEHANLQAKLIQHGKEIKVGEDVNLEIQIVNVGKELVLMNKVENILPLGFELVSKPDYCSVEGTAFVIKGKKLSPLITEEIKISLKSFIKGSVEISPRIICFDETGHQITCKLEPVAFNFLEAALPGRISSGYSDLDDLLLGGIPENYAVILTSPSSDEKEELIKRFLRAGLINGQTTFYITGKLGNVSTLAEKFKSTFYLFICNPRAEIIVQSIPNVFKLKGIDSLTDIDIALTKSFRTIDTSRIGPRRACIEIISDVLLQHHAVITRKWLSGLLPDLKSKGFTTLAVINPEMHPQEEVQAILGLFEGEIKIIERETEKGSEKILRIRKLYNQKYLDTDLVLKKERMEI